ncbi:MAG TPA: hypothetical protein VGE14_06190 [Marmoricola sp.]
MDDAGTPQAPTQGPEATSAEAARQWAEQQRARARAQFDTPSWLGPDRGTSVPQQAGPGHDELEPDEVPVTVAPVASEPIPGSAHWSESAPSRRVAGALLALSLIGVVGFLVAAVVTQSVNAIIGLAACAFVAVVFRGAMMGAGLTTVDLSGSTLRVRRGGALDVVNLADPTYRVDLVGTPDQSAWQARFETVDGRTFTLGPRQVAAAELDRVVRHYRAVAERARLEHDRRFNR